LPTSASEHLVSCATPAAVLDAFHRYRLSSITDRSVPPITATAAAKTKLADGERYGTGSAKKSGKLPALIRIIFESIYFWCRSSEKQWLVTSVQGVVMLSTTI